MQQTYIKNKKRSDNCEHTQNFTIHNFFERTKSEKSRHIQKIISNAQTHKQAKQRKQSEQRLKHRKIPSTLDILFGPPSTPFWINQSTAIISSIEFITK